ncbi:MAG: hypothetical protein GY793_04640 [Proteobacteria bacterium]|nr:hypothetical protein [Pseudomonadota bacterium]
MKKYILFTLIMSLGVTNLEAAEIKEGSLYCISLKTIENYYNYRENGFETSAQKLLDDSDCFIKQRNEKVLFKSETGKYSEVEGLDGFIVWTNNKNIKK